MTDLLTQAEQFLRKHGEPLLADTVRDLAARADSLALELDAAVQMARDISADVRALLGDGPGRDGGRR